jgi:hypothetical protein
VSTQGVRGPQPVPGPVQQPHSGQIHDPAVPMSTIRRYRQQAKTGLSGRFFVLVEHL